MPVGNMCLVNQSNRSFVVESSVYSILVLLVQLESLQFRCPALYIFPQGSRDVKWSFEINVGLWPNFRSSND